MVELHKIYEPDFTAKAPEVIAANVSLWVCIGPFPNDIRHAEEHPNSVALLRSATQEEADQLFNAILEVFRRIGIPCVTSEYPGD